VRGTADILGHEAVIARLWTAAARDGLHHAYLFEGPEGVGKRRVALRLAMAVNCERRGASTELPCGECPTCRAIAAGTHPDVWVVGPDPDRKTPIISVAQIREVVRKVGYHRYQARRRMVVVDPSEALPPSAANALLKTLEEPPDGTGFVLVAHHASALLPTIVSRCQRVRFAAVEPARVSAWLAERGVEAPEALARLSMGRPGAALSLAEGGLEARRTLRGQMLDLLGSGDLGTLFDLSKALATGDRAAWRARVEALLEVIEELMRDATVAASGAEVGLLDPESRGVAEQLARDLWPDGVVRVGRAIEEAREGLDRNANGRVVVDALLARLLTEVGALS